MRRDRARPDAPRPLHVGSLAEHAREPGHGRELGADEGAEEPAAREVHRCRRVVEQVPGQRPQQQEARRVLHVDPFEVALSLEHGKRADRAERRAAVMADDGIRHVAAAVAAEPRPVREVDVLVRREEILVEAAELVVDGLRQEARGPADAEHLARLPGGGRRAAVEPLERAAPQQHAVAGAVDDRGIVHVDDARGGQHEAGPRVDPAAERAQPAALGNRVVVEERHQAAARFAHAGVVAAGEPAILRQRDYAHPRIPLAQVAGRPVRRGVVDDDRLGGHVLLGGDGGEACVEVLATVPGDDDHRDVHVVRRGLVDRHWRLLLSATTRR